MQALIDLLKQALPENAQMQIVDVGANPIERPDYAVLAEAGVAEVTGFEPNPDAFQALRDNAPRYARYVDKAIGLPGNAVFNAYKASEMSSIYKICAKATGFLGQFRRHIGTETEIPVTLHALDDLSTVPAIDLLKVDAQGAECDVVDGAYAKLRGAVAVIVETRFYRIYKDEPLIGELDTTLRKQGFELHKFSHQKSRMLPHSQFHNVNRRLLASQLIDGDAIYIRNVQDKRVLSDNQFCHLAYLAAGVFESHDLALMCLDELVRRGAVERAVPARYVATLPMQLRAKEVAQG